jgi:serine/threonine protein phosphatase PrpC
VVVAITSARIIGVSVGDSEAWVITDTGIDDVTRGQNKSRLGSGRASPVSFFRPRLEGTLVVGSDGLFRYAKMESVAEAVRGRAPAKAAEELRGLVVLPSGQYQDDLGLVVVREAHSGLPAERRTDG